MVRLLTVLVCAGLVCGMSFSSARAQSSAVAQPLAHDVFAEDGPADARKLFVRIPVRFTEGALKDLANKLAAKSKAGTRLALLHLYLAGSDRSGDPWAIVRMVEGSPQISVLGLRAEEEAAYRDAAQADTRDVIGHWLTSPPALPGKLTILRGQGGRLIAEWHVRNGQKTTDEVVASRSSRGQRFDVTGGDGNYYLAAWNGTLQLGDATRVIAIAERLAVDKRTVAPLAANKNTKPSLINSGRSALGNPPGAAQSLSAGPVAASGAIAPAVASTAATPQAPVATAPKPRRTGRAAAARKPRSSVADLMSSSTPR